MRTTTMRKRALPTFTIAALLALGTLSTACTDRSASPVDRGVDRGGPTSVAPTQPSLVPQADLERAGPRSAGRLTLSRDDGRVEVEYEIHTAVVGERWKVDFYRNGTLFATATGTTVPEDQGGGLSISRLAPDGSSGTFSVRAQNLATNEVATATATI